ncbi:hypothetical protein HanPSC8_Chr04g0174771 [Helianthus annuus]|nr:hypothetical protein HanPSC8_Chr04g0174771 [Helianthus annuus]
MGNHKIIVEGCEYPHQFNTLLTLQTDTFCTKSVSKMHDKLLKFHLVLKSTPTS